MSRPWAGERPRHRRRGTRVVVTDLSSVLLLADTDPGVPGSRWWVTPGGGIDAGEDDRTARREAQRTGQRLVLPARREAFRVHARRVDLDPLPTDPVFSGQ